ncbi:MAG: GGDEF domain-containing protein, partial [Endomicrobiales bacterium]
KRIAGSVPFAMIYLDINNFKSFNDKYGFQRGDEVIKNTANVIIRASREAGGKGDFIGHIGGDDFIAITSPENASRLCEIIIRLFDESVPSFYDPEDRGNGYIVSVDRTNTTKKFPLMTVSLAVISTAQTRVTHYGQLSTVAAELKKVAKQRNHSAYVMDRRKE